MRRHTHQPFIRGWTGPAVAKANGTVNCVLKRQIKDSLFEMPDRPRCILSVDRIKAQMQSRYEKVLGLRRRGTMLRAQPCPAWQSTSVLVLALCSKHVASLYVCLMDGI